MNVSAKYIQRHFELLSDAALLATTRDDLTELARESYDEEVLRRGLAADAVPEATEEAGAVQQEAASGEMVVVGTFTVAEEASLARGLLDSAEIPCKIATDYVAMGRVEFQLLVLKEFEEQALEILEYQISDEELEAQAAEAAEAADL